MKYIAAIDPKAILKVQQRVVRCLLPEDHIYHEIMDRLLSRLDLIRLNPATILNIVPIGISLKNVARLT